MQISSSSSKQVSYGVNTSFGDAGYRVAPSMPLTKPKYKYDDVQQLGGESTAALAFVFPKNDLTPKVGGGVSPNVAAFPSLPAGQVSPQSPGAFPCGSSPAYSEHSTSSAPNAQAVANLLVTRVVLKNRPAVAANSLGDKPWFLSLASRELYEAEMKLGRLVGAHWLAYKTWYDKVPASVLEI